MKPPSVEGLYVNASHHISRQGEEVTFTITLDAGSDVNVTMLVDGEPLNWVYFTNATYTPEAVMTYNFTVGTRMLIFTANNSVSSQEFSLSLSTQQAMTGFAVTNEVLSNRTVLLHWSVTEASYLVCKVNIGDTSMVMLYNDVVESPSIIAHYYNSSGDYSVQFCCYNTFSMNSSDFNVTVETAIVIDDKYIVPTIVNISEAFNVALPVVSGNPIYVFVDFGDDIGTCNRTYREDWNFTAAVDLITFSVMYKTSGEYNMSVTVFNAVSSVTIIETVHAYRALDSLMLELKAAESGEPFNVTVTASGSCFPDCNAVVDVDKCDRLEGKVHSNANDMIRHTFVIAKCDVGIYNVTVEMTNTVSWVSAMNMQYIEKKINEVSIEFKYTNYNQVVLKVKVNPSQVTVVADLHYTCVHEFGTGSPTITSKNDVKGQDNVGMEVLQNYTCLGTYQYKSTCFNRISSSNSTVKVEIARPLGGVSLLADFYHLVNASVNFTVHVDEGGPIKYTAQLLDGPRISEQVSIMPANMCDSTTFNDSSFLYTFDTPGEFQVILVVPSIHGNKSDTKTVRILEPITGLDATTSQPTIIMPGNSVIFSVSIVTGNSANCSGTFGDYYQQKVFPDGAANISFDVTFSVVGKVIPKFFCENFFTNDTYIFEAGVFVQSPIEELQIDYPRVPVAVDAVVTLQLQVSQGNPVTYTINYGNNSFDSQTFATHLDALHIDNVNMSHVFNASDPVGAYSIHVSASNLFGSQYKTIYIDVHELVTGLSVEMRKVHVRVEELLTFTVNLRTGTSAVCYTDLGDGRPTIIEHFRRQSAMRPVEIGYMYEQPGNFTPTFLINNTLSMDSYTWPEEIIVQHPIIGITLSGESPVAIPTGVGMYSVELTSPETLPTNPFCNWTFVDGITKMVFTEKLGQGLKYRESFTYGEEHTGHQIVAVNCSNLVSWHMASTTVMVQRKVEDVNITVLTPAIAAGETAKFGVTAKKGSHLKYEVHFADSIKENYTHPNALNSTSSLDIEHEYTTVGNYTLLVNVSNDVSFTVVAAQKVVVQSPIEELQIDYPRVPVAVDAVVTLQLQVSQGNPVTYTINYGNDSSDSQTFATPPDAVRIDNANMSHVFNASDPVGAYPVHVRASNLFGSQYKTIYIDVHELVTGLSVEMRKVHVRVEESLIFNVNLRTGTSAVCYADLGNGRPTIIEYFRRQSAMRPVEISYMYEQPGNFTPKFLVNNTLSINSYTWPDEIIVQHPIIGITLSGKSPIVIPTGIGMYSVELTSLEPFPSNPFCNWTFADGTTKIVFAEKLGQGLKYRESFTYGEEHTGYQIVAVNCSNLVSWHMASTTVMVQRKVEDVSIRVLTPEIAVGETAKFDITVKKGSHLKYEICFADSSEANYTHPNALNSTSSLDIEHEYMTVGNYTLLVNVSNDVSFTVVAAQKVVVQSPIEELQIDYPRVPVAVDAVVTLQLQVSQGNPVTYTINYGNDSFDSQTFATPPDALHIDNVNMSHVFNASDPVSAYPVHVRASNLFGSQYKTIYIDVHELVTGLSVEMRKVHVRVEELLTFTVNLRTGTSAVCYADLGDGRPTIIEYFRRQSAMRPVEISYMYEQPGNFTPKFLVNNTLSMDSYTWPEEIIVQHPIIGITLSGKSPIVIPIGIGMYSVELTSPEPFPSNPFCNWTFADGTTKIVFAEKLGQGLKYIESFTYGEEHTGYQIVAVNCSNLVSWHTASTTVMVQRKVEDVSITVLTPEIAVGETAKFDITVKKGSHLKYEIHFADSSKGNYTHPNALNSTSSLDIEHEYTTVGNYTLLVNVSNDVSFIVVAAQKVVVQSPIEELQIDYPRVPVAVDAVVTLQLQVSQGNPVTYTINYGDDSSDSQTFATPPDAVRIDNINMSHVFNASDPVGAYSIHVRASNLFGSQYKTIYIDVHELVTGLSVEMQKIHIRVEELLTFTVNLRTGTSAVCYADLGDGRPTIIEYFRRQSAMRPVEISYMYEQPGNFTPKFLVNNTLSINSYTWPEEIIVQHPIIGITLSGESPVVIPTGIGMYSVELTSPEPFPSNPFCNWTFADGTTKIVFAEKLGQGLKYRESFTYGEEHTGYQIVAVNCSNLVSWHMASTTVVVQRKVEDVSIRVLTPEVAVGETAKFDITVKKGSHLKYEVHFADSSEGNYSHLNALNSTSSLDIEHEYTTVGNYTLLVNVSNDVSFIIVAAPQPVVVQAPLYGLEVTSNSPVGTPPGLVTYTVSAEEGVHAGNIFFWWIFGDGGTTKWQYADSVTADAPHTQIHTYRGRDFSEFTTFVNCSNLISYIIIETSVIVEAVIEEISVNVSESVAIPGQVVNFTVSARQGSNMTYALNYGDNTPVDEKKEYAANTDVEFLHKYSLPGNYTVLLTATNKVIKRETYLSSQVVVQYPLEESHIILTYDNIVSTKAPSTAFSIALVVGTHEPTNVIAAINTSYGFSWWKFVGQWPFKWSQRFDGVDLGKVVENITLSNLVSSLHLDAVVFIMEPITELDVVVPGAVKTGHPVTIIVKMDTGSDLNGTVAFGDGVSEEVTWMGTLHLYNITHNYTLAGAYQVAVTGKANSLLGLSQKNYYSLKKLLSISP